MFSRIPKSLRSFDTIWFITGSIIFFIALIAGFFTRIIDVFTYVDFLGDQVRDSIALQEMWRGDFIGYGPGSSIGGYALPPLYFYLAFPFTILGPEPVWVAASNALFSFLTIPLLGLFTYCLITPGAFKMRSIGDINKYNFFISSVMSFWWVWLFNEILLTTRSWNPSTIPFFLMLQILIFAYLLDVPKSRFRIPLWIIAGLNVGLLVSLHSTTMFVIPVVFGIFLVHHWVRFRDIKAILVGVVSSVVSLLPYWGAELISGWQNTRAIATLITGPTEEPITLLGRVNRAMFNYVELGDLLIFPNMSNTSLSHFIMTAVLVGAALLFRGKKSIWHYLLVVGVIYSYAVSSYSGILFIHYKMVLFIVPMLAAAILLERLRSFNKHQYLHIACTLVLTVGMIGISLSFNTQQLSKWYAAKYSSTRLPNTHDMAQQLEKVPEETTVCIDQRLLSSYQYISEYVNKQSHSFSLNCEESDYYIYPKYRFYLDKGIQRNDEVQVDYTEDFSIFLEDDVTIIRTLR